MNRINVSALDEREPDGWTVEGIAKRLTLMAEHGDHLTVGERNACAAAARRLRAPDDRRDDEWEVNAEEARLDRKED